MAKFRVLPSTWGSIQTVNGNTYNASPGTVLDVPSADVQSLPGYTPICLSGPTSQRPAANNSTVSPLSATAGTFFLDTTLAKIVVYDGQTWRDPVTMAAA